MITDIDVAKRLILAIALEDNLLGTKGQGRWLVGKVGGVRSLVIPSRYYGGPIDSRIHGRVVNKLIAEGVLVKDRRDYGVHYDKVNAFIDSMFVDVDELDHLSIFSFLDDTKYLGKQGTHYIVDLFDAPLSLLKGLYTGKGFGFWFYNYHNATKPSAICVLHKAWAAKSIADELFVSNSTCVQDLYFMLTGGEKYPMRLDSVTSGGREVDMDDLNKSITSCIHDFKVEDAGSHLTKLKFLLMNSQEDHTYRMERLNKVIKLVEDVALGSTTIGLLDNVGPNILLVDYKSGYKGGNTTVEAVQSRVKLYLETREDYHGD